MRFPLAIAACFGLLVSLTATDQASAQPQLQPQSTSRLLVFDGRTGDQPGTQSDGTQSDGAQSDTAASGVRILRGSPATPRAAPAREGGSILGPGRVQAVAGEELWLFDRHTQRLASCRNRGTANVGQRVLECTFGTFGRYRRTFGNNFPH